MDETLLHAIVAVVAGLALAWLVLVSAVLVAARRFPDTALLKVAVRLLPDTIGLVRRLATDPTLLRGVRVRLWFLLGYLLLPIDLVPDFLPVVGYADDAVIVALVLRSVVRAADTRALDNHWPGTPTGLATLRRLCRLESAS